MRYRSLCPRCGYPNTLPVPDKQRRKTLDFTCSCETLGTGDACSAKYRVYVKDTETYEPSTQKQKSYMSRGEREAFLIAANISDHFANHIIENVQNLSDETRYAYQKAQEWLAYGSYEWVKGKEAKTVQTLHRDSKLYTIGLVAKRDAKEIARKNASADAAMRNEIITENREPILDLALATFQFCCRNCDGSPASTEAGCPVKHALDALEMPPWEAEGAACHYAYSGLTDEEIAERRAGK